MGKRGRGKGGVGKAKARPRPYPYGFRIKMVRLCPEEGYSTTVIREQFGVSSHWVQRWAKAYYGQRTGALVVKLGTKAKPKRANQSRQRIRSNPDFLKDRVRISCGKATS